MPEESNQTFFWEVDIIARADLTNNINKMCIERALADSYICIKLRKNVKGVIPNILIAKKA